MIKLRNYQESIIKNIRIQLVKHNRIILCAPTGSGKTIIFSFIAKSASEKNNRILVLTNRGELLEQTGGAFNQLKIAHDWLSAESKYIPESNVVIAMVETLHRRLNGKLTESFINFVKSFKIIIIDENHRCEFDKIFTYLNHNSLVLGVTATPYRTGKMKPLKDFYDIIVEGCTIDQLIKENYLANPEYYGIPADLSTVHKQAGEFKTSDLDKIFADKKTFEGLTKNYERLFKGRKSIIFAPSINSANTVINELKKCVSEPIFYVDSELNSNIRNQQLTNFYKTYPAIMVNVGILTTGYDCPTIDTVILYRATTSLPLYLQMVGRGSRVTETKKTFRIIDFGDNVRRHGFWHEDRFWKLENEKLPKEGVAPVKNCGKCNALIHASLKMCPYCGFVFPVNKSKDKVINIELVEILENEKFTLRNSEHKYTVKELISIQQQKNYKSGFVLIRLKTIDRFNEYAKLHGYSSAWVMRNYIYWNKICIK